jgi:hypothetical protein
MGVDLRFHDGQAAATIDGTTAGDAAPPQKKERSRPKKRSDDRQGKLL